MWIMQPFLVLRGAVLPDPANRPFTITGCIVDWRGMGDMGGQGDIEKNDEVEEVDEDYGVRINQELVLLSKVSHQIQVIT